MTGPKCLRCLSICQPEAGLFLQVAGIWGGSGAWLYRTEPSGFTPCDPVVKYGDISISVGDATCQQKADWKMKRTEMERLSDSLKFIRLTEGGRTPMRGVHLWGFRSGVNLLSPFSSFSLCPVVCLCVCLAAYLFLPGSAGLLARLSMCVSLSGVSLLPWPLAICVWLCSHAPDSSAHRWCRHLLWNPRRRQGAQSFPESQGAAGDQTP